MSDTEALAAHQLYHRVDPERFAFSSTDELEGLSRPVGQERALQAIDFGVGMRHHGYNLFLVGSTGLGKHATADRVLRERARAEPVPHDWCYINNFEVEHKPYALRLPPGRGRQLSDDMERLVEDLLNAIPAAFQSHDYVTRAQEISDEYKEKEQEAFQELNEEAQRNNVAILSTPNGYTLAPMKEGKTLGPDEFEQLPEEEQQRIEQVIEDLKQQMKETVRQVPVWQRESRERFKELNREVTERTVDAFIRDLKQRYEDLPRVQGYLEAVKQDVVENVDVFRQQAEQQQQQSSVQQTPRRSQEFNRYLVNVLVDNDDQSGAPVLYEDNPVYQNLIGRIEHRAQMGALTTDFTLIKPGAVHRANGGYLILDVRQLLTRPFAWEGIKRVLSAREIRIQGPEQWYGLAGTVSLEPEPIPLDIKVLLTGDRILYYLLQQYDPEFNLLFKATADFAEDIDRSGENTDLYARMIASLQSQEALRPFDRTGVARVIEHCARSADDAEKLSVHMGTLVDLLRESDYWAGTNGRQVIGAEDVQRAIDAQVYRVDQLRERIHEAILRDTLMIATDGSEVAQVNGLSVVQLGDFTFGRPNRISATARLGEGKVIDIEREAELGGKIHSKGVMILSSYLAHRYEPERPLSLAASLVFEQSYAMVEGDSASAAELCALVSALSGVALKQAMAITGSVNQHGQIQPIGGVNEKVEGFFDVCRQRELTGAQGVIIPKANVKHLMLRRDVVEACEAKRFHVWPVDHVDQAISLLTGQAAGAPDAEGRFPQGTVNRRVRDRLLELSNLRLAFARESRGEGEGDG